MLSLRAEGAAIFKKRLLRPVPDGAGLRRYTPRNDIIWQRLFQAGI